MSAPKCVLVAEPGRATDPEPVRSLAAVLRADPPGGLEVVAMEGGLAASAASVPALATAAAERGAALLVLSIRSGLAESVCLHLQTALAHRHSAARLLVVGVAAAAERAALLGQGVVVLGPDAPPVEVTAAARALVAGPVGEAGAAPAPAAIRALRLDHAALCVKDLDAAVALFEALLGQPMAHREVVATQKVSAAFFDFPNGASLELISPAPSLGGNPGLEKFLEKRGDALHHLALRVDGLDALLLRLEARGVPLIDRVSRPGARGHRVAFLHPKALGGALLELVEAAE